MIRLLALVAVALIQVPRGTTEISLSGSSLAIEYGRPSLEGRDMLGRAPVGTVWRLGADRSTTMTVTGTAVFGNIVVAEGEYSLFLERTSEKQWSLIVNKQTGQWGTEHDRKQDLAAVPLKWDKQDASTDSFTITMSEETADTGLLSFVWGQDVLTQRFRLVSH